MASAGCLTGWMARTAPSVVAAARLPAARIFGLHVLIALRLLLRIAPGAAVLALLPIPGGNLDQNRAYNHLMDLRSDLYYAAQRSQNLQEFREMIRDMRLRKEREEEFKRNQRTAPPPQEPPTP